MALSDAATPIDIVKEAADGFGPLKAVLRTISAIYTSSKVCFQPLLTALH